MPITTSIALQIAGSFLVIGAADFGYRQFAWRKRLRMTTQEVKEEYKETEGNPLFKSLRRQRHREILMQSVMAAVRRADVVVVNPGGGMADGTPLAGDRR